MLDSWVRYEGQVKQRQQKELAQSIIAKVTKELENPKVLQQILQQSVADVESTYSIGQPLALSPRTNQSHRDRRFQGPIDIHARLASGFPFCCTSVDTQPCQLANPTLRFTLARFALLIDVCVVYRQAHHLCCEGGLENGGNAGQMHQRSPSTFKGNAGKAATPGYLYLRRYRVTRRVRVEVAGLEGNPWL